MTIRTFADLCEQNQAIAVYYVKSISKEEQEVLKAKLQQRIVTNAIMFRILAFLLTIIICVALFG